MFLNLYEGLIESLWHRMGDSEIDFMEMTFPEDEISYYCEPIDVNI